MFFNQIFITITLCATIALCNDEILIRRARTIPLDSSLFLAWSQAFRNFWHNRRFWEWTKNNAVGFARLISYPDTTKNHLTRIVFRPEDGQRAAQVYQQRFGYRGQWLIEQLGNGLGPDVPSYKQSVLHPFLIPPSLSIS